VKTANTWPRGVTSWVKDRTLKISVPFTWALPDAAQLARQRSTLWDQVLVGGPAAYLQPDHFTDIPGLQLGLRDPDALHHTNPDATRTTYGCPNSCPFCAVPQIAPAFRELADWPDRPVLIDDNLLAASQQHLDRVFDRLERHDTPDFNQGLDARLLNDYHAERLARLNKPTIRLALDHANQRDTWQRAYDTLRKHGIFKYQIRSYALIAFNTGPDEAWDRCQWIEDHGTKALPMWYHQLDATKRNQVTPAQQQLGWTDFDRRRIMQWFYQHKRAARGAQ